MKKRIYSLCVSIVLFMTVFLLASCKEQHEHTIVTDNAVAATCTESGLTEGSHCSECGEVMVEQQIIPANGHNFENGTCTRCGADEPSCFVETVVMLSHKKPDSVMLN